MIDCGFDPRSGQTKIKFVFGVFLLHCKHAVLSSKNIVSDFGLGVRIKCKTFFFFVEALLIIYVHLLLF